MKMQCCLAVALFAFAGLAVAATTPSAATAAAPAPASPAKATGATPAPLDINTATREELIKQPAIGAAIADRIIAGRPWGAKNELVTKQVLSKAAYDKVAKFIIAKQPPKAPALKAAAVKPVTPTPAVAPAQTATSAAKPAMPAQTAVKSALPTQAAAPAKSTGAATKATAKAPAKT